MKKPPSKFVLALAGVPFFIAVMCMVIFGNLGISKGVIISIVALVVYYVIFGIVYAIISLKNDKAQQEFDKAASTPLKVATVILIIFTVGVVAGAFAGYFTENPYLLYGCIGAFVAGILLFVIVHSFSTRVRTTPPKSADKTGEGVCVMCVHSSSVSYMSGVGKNGAQYTDKVTYKVIIELDGRSLTAYSHCEYDIGETVKVAYSDKSNKCYIVYD